MLNQAINHPAVEARTRGRLWRAARTTLLLAGGTFASILMVDLPAPAGSVGGGHAMAKSHVAASEKWIALGTARSKATAVDPGVTPASEEERQRSRRRPRGVQIASLGRDTLYPGRPGPGFAVGGIRWNASSACLNPTLRRIIGEVAASFGPVTVNSTCRGREHNARVGGSKHSQHLTGNAVDFRIAGNPRTVLAFLSSHRSVGGSKHYGGGVFHIDTGPRRGW